jgi:hypothetical protein
MQNADARLRLRDYIQPHHITLIYSNPKKVGF